MRPFSSFKIAEEQHVERVVDLLRAASKKHLRYLQNHPTKYR
jgi:hypothetical protein